MSNSAVLELFSTGKDHLESLLKNKFLRPIAIDADHIVCVGRGMPRSCISSRLLGVSVLWSKGPTGLHFCILSLPPCSPSGAKRAILLELS